jgi:predicted peptidase
MLSFLFLIYLFGINLSAQEGGIYIPQVFTSANGEKLNYNIMYPEGFDKNSKEKYPLFLFFHGAGERGSDNKAQLVHGSKLFQDSLSKYPAIYILPQCPRDDYWVKMKSEGSGQARQMKIVTDQGPNPAMKLVLELIDLTLSESYIDESRFYVAGLSMGGMATMELGWRIPEKIAAAIAICGVGPVEKASDMKEVPFWFVHGVEDGVVPSRYSVAMVQAMQLHGGKARITLYPDVNHNSWDNVFADPEFFTFLFTKQKGI